MERLTLTAENLPDCLQRAVEVLRAGGLVIYPTETVYGIGVDACSEAAVTTLLQFKNRPAGKAISILVADAEMAEQYIERNATARSLYELFLPGPVTVVSADKGVVDKRLPSELKTLGVRISSHFFASALPKAFDGAVTTTSANTSGGARPYTIDKLLMQFSDAQRERIGLIIDAGELPRKEPSSVIDTTQTVQELVRGGSNSYVLEPPVETASEAETQAYAGQLLQKYAHALAEKPIVITLEGDLGMGKTRFAKGLATVLGVKEVVTSPTYTILKEYRGEYQKHPIWFIHVDCWRANTLSAEDINLAGYLQTGTVVAIEWPQPLMEYLRSIRDQAVVLRVRFRAGEGDRRRIDLLGL